MPPLEQRLLSEKNVDRLYALSELDDVSSQQKGVLARKAVFGLTLGDNGYERRSQIIRRFRHDYGELITAPAIEALCDSGYQNPWIAANCLGKLTRDQAVRLLKNWRCTRCRDDFQVLGTIAWNIARIDSITPYLVSEIEQERPHSDRLAVMSLGRVENKDSIVLDVLFRCLNEDTSTYVRMIAFNALFYSGRATLLTAGGRFHDISTVERYNLKDHLNTLISCLDLNDLSAREQAIYLLMELGLAATPAVPKLVPMLQDTVHEVRLAAARTLVAINVLTPEIESALKQAAMVKDMQAYEFTDALRKLQENQRYRESFYYFNDLLGSQHDNLGSTAWAVYHDPRTMKKVLGKADNDTMEIRRNVAELLGAMPAREKAAEKVLCKLADDRELEVRIAAVQSLGKIAWLSSLAQATLLEILSKDSAAVFEAAEQVVMMRWENWIGVQSGQIVECLLNNKQSKVTNKAMTALAPWALPVVFKGTESRDTVIQRRAWALLGAIGYCGDSAFLERTQGSYWNEILQRVQWPSSKVDSITVVKLLPRMMVLAAAETTWTFRSTLGECAGKMPALVKMILPYLSSGDTEQQRAVLNILVSWLFRDRSNLEVEPLLPLVVANMRSHDTRLRNAAANVLDRLCQNRDMSDTMLIGFVNDSSAFVRLKMVESLLWRRRNITGGEDDLLALLDSQDPAVRKLVLSVLRNGSMYTLKHEKKLVALLLWDSAYGLQPEILDVLIQKHSVDKELLASTMAVLVNSSDPLIRSKAIALLSAQYGDQRTYVPYYLSAIADTSMEVASAVNAVLKKHHRLLPQQECLGRLRAKMIWCIENGRTNDFCGALDSLQLNVDQIVDLIGVLDSVRYWHRARNHDDNIRYAIDDKLLGVDIRTRDQARVIAKYIADHGLRQREVARFMDVNRHRLPPCMCELLMDQLTSREAKSNLLYAIARMEQPPDEIQSCIVAQLNSNDIGLQNEAGAVLKKMNCGHIKKLLKHWYFIDSMANPCFADY
jgi:HEAT repeat protein